MRVLSVVFSLVVAVSLVGAALFYLEERIGQQRIQVQDGWISSSEQQAYQAYGQVTSTALDSLPNEVDHRDSSARR